MRHSFFSALIAVGSALQAAAQLNGKVGPLTTASAKAAIKTCNIVDYGAKANAKTDNGPAIQKAWNDCRTGGGEVYVPEGDYGMGTWVTLTSSKPMSFRLDGIIYRIGTDGGNMFMFKHLEDFELYSSTSKGAIQGYGYEFHKKDEYGPRILRFADVKSFSIHDVALVDCKYPRTQSVLILTVVAPAFHFSIDTCSDGEVFNMAIHGGNRGGLDGIDVWGTNIHIHDVEVSNKDECVTVKNPSDHLLIENIFCNWSGGCAMGSLATGTDIHDIEYNNIYTQRSNQMYMFKSYGGSGTVNNVALKNFAGHSNAYTLDLDAQWSSMKPIAGDGILYTNMTFSGWSGTCADGHQRGPIKFNCPADVPCTDMQVDDFTVGSNKGDTVEHVCKNAYGSGACLKEGDGGAYTTTQTVDAASAGTPTMDGELENGLGLTVSIAIPTIRASFFPGVAAISPRMADAAKAQATARVQTPVPAEAETAADTSAVDDVTVLISVAASSAISAAVDELTTVATLTASVDVTNSLLLEEPSSLETTSKASSCKVKNYL
ncbi:murein transglycosylase [Fusarium acutatum]|uniref:Murein transglycosylase n=1 Tax=Fusarium acutatum TaxID=78861 RepID=A0A8H4NN82_9HYPO|nr:murein transglycosylase [Fusarium acutatum]